MKIDAEALRTGMRNWASGVSVVSTKAGDVIHGLTVSSLLSVSLEPPIMLISVRQSTRTHKLIKQSSIFGISVLSENQKDISDRFASFKTEQYDRFVGIDVYTLSTGAPLITSSLVGLDCRVVRSVEIETHTLFFGEVEALKIGDKQKPLVYYDQDYRKLII